VSLKLSYRFNTTTEPLPKKRKIQDSRRSQAIIEYSAIKLPAHEFVNYLENNLNKFIEDCLR
jgi:hypothetical protein